MTNEKPEFKKCKHCKTEIPFNAKICPQYRKKQKSGITKWIIVAIVVIAIIGVAGCQKGTTNKDLDSAKTETSTKPTEVTTAATNISETDGEDNTEVTTAATSLSETDSKDNAEDKSVPNEYKSALNKAASYSDTMHMSKAGIYDQLTSEYGEKFSSEAAQYAIDNMEADWNANALEKAKDYSTTMYMSKKGVYDQLISDYGEKFTEEEAQYAADNVEADWQANALEKAKSYQDSMDMSPEAIRDQLTSEYGEQFTVEEADYAIANLN